MRCGAAVRYGNPEPDVPCWRKERPRKAGCPQHVASPKGGNSMKRRDFIKATGVGVAGAAGIAAPAIAQSAPEIKWRMTCELAEIARYAVWRRRAVGQGGRRSDRQQVPDPGFRRRRNRSRPAGGRCRAERHRRDGAHRVVLLFRQGPDLRLRHLGRRSDPNQRDQPGLVHARRRQGSAQRVLQEIQRHSRSLPAIPAARWAAGSARKSTPLPISRA